MTVKVSLAKLHEQLSSGKLRLLSSVFVFICCSKFECPPFPKSSIWRKNKTLTVMRHPNVPPHVCTWRSRTHFHMCWGETTYASSSVHRRNKQKEEQMQASWCRITDGFAASSNANNYMPHIHWWKGSIVNVCMPINTHISKGRRDKALINVSR